MKFLSLSGPNHKNGFMTTAKKFSYYTCILLCNQKQETDIFLKQCYNANCFMRYILYHYICLTEFSQGSRCLKNFFLTTKAKLKINMLIFVTFGT